VSLTWLFDHVLDPKTRKRYDLRDVSARIAKLIAEGMTGPNGEKIEPISSGYISELRAGTKTNPTDGRLAGLAVFFGVRTLEYFKNEAVAADVQNKLLVLGKLQSLGVRSLAMRAAADPELDKTLDAVAAILERLGDLQSGPHGTQASTE